MWEKNGIKFHSVKMMIGLNIAGCSKAFANKLGAVVNPGRKNGNLSLRLLCFE